MIEAILTELNSRLPANIAQEVRTLCTIVQEGDRSYPALYVGNDQLRQVANYQWQSGFIFWLPNGEESTELLDEVRGGKDRIGITFPLRLYWVGSRTAWQQDSQYTGQNIALAIQKAIQARNIPTLRASLGLDRIRTTVENYKYGRDVVEEFLNGIPNPLRHDMEAVRLDVSLEVHGTLECIVAASCPEEAGFLLLEDGGFFLLETGGKLQLE